MKKKCQTIMYRCHSNSRNLPLTLLHSERPKLHTISPFLSAVGLNNTVCKNYIYFVLSLAPLTMYIIIREVTSFGMVGYSKSFCKSCNFQIFQKSPKFRRSTKSVSNRTILLHPLLLFFMNLQTLRPNAFHLILWCIW